MGEHSEILARQEPRRPVRVFNPDIEFTDNARRAVSLSILENRTIRVPLRFGATIGLGVRSGAGIELDPAKIPMLAIAFTPGALKVLTRDGWLLFLSRFVRLFAYGSLSVVLVFYLISLGLSQTQTGTLLTLTLVGDTVISLYLTTGADRIGRQRMLRNSDGGCRHSLRLH